MYWYNYTTVKCRGKSLRLLFVVFIRVERMCIMCTGTITLLLTVGVKVSGFYSLFLCFITVTEERVLVSRVLVQLL